MQPKNKVSFGLNLKKDRKARKELNLKKSFVITAVRALAFDVTEPYFEKRFISESKLWEIIGHYRLKGNIIAMVVALKMLIEYLKSFNIGDMFHIADWI